MKLPRKLNNKIVDFLSSMPNIHDDNMRRALIDRAGLDLRLQDQIAFTGSSAPFFQTLVPILIQYGTLEDGRHALEAVLESAKSYVGQNRQDYCDTLIQEFRAVQHSRKSQRRAMLKTEELSQLSPQEIDTSEISRMKAQQNRWWEQMSTQVGGDMIVGELGQGATGAAIGKNITQNISPILGEAQPDDKEIIEEKFSNVRNALQQLQGTLEPAVANMAEFQLTLLQGELSKTEKEEVPSSSTITRVGDWLLDNIPGLAEALASLFATSAVDKVVGKAGRTAVEWGKKRFAQ